MRNVVAYELLSLDGVAEQPDEFFHDFDHAMEENLGRVIHSQSTVLLGRRTYDEWSQFWPSSDIEPFASFINGVEKFIVTSTTPAQAWRNASVVDGDPMKFVSDLKRTSGDDIGVHGSIVLTQSLLAAGLVDELRLVIAPVLQGRGRGLFDESRPTRLTLVDHTTSPKGYLLLGYRVPG